MYVYSVLSRNKNSESGCRRINRTWYKTGTTIPMSWIKVIAEVSIDVTYFKVILCEEQITDRIQAVPVTTWNIPELLFHLKMGNKYIVT